MPGFGFTWGQLWGERMQTCFAPALLEVTSGQLSDGLKLLVGHARLAQQTTC